MSLFNRVSELYTNQDGRLSTTSTIQFLSWLVATILLLCAYIHEKPFVIDWFIYYLSISVLASPATKGAVSIFKQVKDSRHDGI